MRRLALLVSLFGIIFGVCAAPQYRDFKDTQGRIIRARVLKFDSHAEMVTIQRDDKRTSKIPLSKFSEADQAYIQNIGNPASVKSAESEKETKPATDTLLPPPEKEEMTLAELLSNIFSLDGKIIKTKINAVSGVEQFSQNQYCAWCLYRSGSGESGKNVLVCEEGKKIFFKLDSYGYSAMNPSTVYLLVHDKKPSRQKGYHVDFKLEAVGTRFIKSKGIYRW